MVLKIKIRPDKRTKRQLDRIEQMLVDIFLKENDVQVDLSELLASVAEQKTVDASIEALVEGLAAKLDALSLLPTVDPAAIAAIAADIRTANAAIQNSVTANTPAAEPPAGGGDPTAPGQPA